jgi:hypothetical protein
MFCKRFWAVVFVGLALHAGLGEPGTPERVARILQSI